MGIEITLDVAEHEARKTMVWLEGVRKAAWYVAVAVLLPGLLLAAWHVRSRAPYSSSSDFAYYLGLAGGLLMLALLLYPLRKRMRTLQVLGPLRIWFRFHMLAGLLGPTLVLFHSTFHVRSLNAAVALASMLLVAASGVVGRFLYRRIHRGLYGSRTSHEEMQQSLDRQLQQLRAAPLIPAGVKQEIERYARLVNCVPEGRWHRAVHFLSLGVRRRLAGRLAHRAMARHTHPASTVMHGALADLNALLMNIDATLRAAQATAQFATYERLFSHWHTIHIPFLFMLVITALVHVVAVHAY